MLLRGRGEDDGSEDGGEVVALRKERDLNGARGRGGRRRLRGRGRGGCAEEGARSRRRSRTRWCMLLRGRGGDDGSEDEGEGLRRGRGVVSRGRNHLLQRIWASWARMKAAGMGQESGWQAVCGVEGGGMTGGDGWGEAGMTRRPWRRTRAGQGHRERRRGPRWRGHGEACGHPR
jgi:hypothetical protein